MLNENIRAIRKSKGLSQEEFAVRINVVRQTVSKWERGLSVPDSDMLIAISDVLETPVSVLLGETVTETAPEDMKAISEKLETINLQLARRKDAHRKMFCWIFIGIAVLVLGIFLVMVFSGSPYLAWNYNDPETAVMGTALHAFEFIFVRAAPFVFLGSIAGAVLTRKHHD